MRLQLLTLVATGWALSALAFPALAQEALHDNTKSQSDISRSSETAIPSEDNEPTDAGTDVSQGDPPDVAQKALPAPSTLTEAVVSPEDHSKAEESKAPEETLDSLEKARSGSSEAGVTPGNKEAPEINGYASNRLAYSHTGPFSTRDTPSLLELLEANMQLRVNLGSKQNFMYADASLFYQGGWLFRTDGTDRLTLNAGHDIPALHPYFVPSEIYLSLSARPWLNFLVGKKRIIWGSGLTFNPTNLLSPAKDPTDPNLQRAGNWVARVELPFEKVTFTALFAPQALYTEAGIPYAMLRYPSYQSSNSTEVRDNATHYLAAGRVYALLGDADLNLMYFFSNHYQNNFRHKSRFGVSFARYFFTDYEFHLEALLTRGSARDFACDPGAAGCSDNPTFAASKLESKTFYPRVLVGTRRQFADESMLTLEYYYQGDGYTDREFARAVPFMSTSAVSAATGDQSNALPQSFSFDPMRRHYLFASYNKPRIFDDWTAGAMLLAGLRDLSGLFVPSVSWSTKEWLTLTVYGYVPIHGLGVGEVTANNRKVSEYSLMPFDYRVLFESRVYY
jgi:hypothetical protein